MPTILDLGAPRPLTSREIAKVLTGIIGCVVTLHPPSLVIMPDVIERVRHGNQLDFEGLDELAARRQRSCGPHWPAALLATVVGLSTWCRPDDVDTALAWCAENLDEICGGDFAVTPAN